MNEESERLTEVLYIRVSPTQRQRLERLAKRLAVKPTDAARVTMGLGIEQLQRQEKTHAKAM